MLEKKDFEKYIWQCFFDFLDKKEPYKNRVVSTFSAYDSVNRNPSQVPEELWKGLIQRHIYQFNYN